jgi:hypothetical protein
VLALGICGLTTMFSANFIDPSSANFFAYTTENFLRILRE